MPSLKPPYKETQIKDITSENRKLALSGIIVSKNHDRISVDDGTGVINILAQTELPINTFVRVCGFLIDYGNGYELQANLVQDLSGVNQKLYKKLKSLL